MKYEEIVLKVREGVEEADARDIFEHIAVQVDIEGEGSGAFYIEVADRKVVVEPYDYYDRDGRVFANAETLIAIAEGKMTIAEAIKNGVLRAEGNHDKLTLLNKIRIKKAKKAVKTADKPKTKTAKTTKAAAATKTAATKEDVKKDAKEGKALTEAAGKAVKETVAKAEAKVAKEVKAVENEIKKESKVVKEEVKAVKEEVKKEVKAAGEKVKAASGKAEKKTTKK